MRLRTRRKDGPQFYEWPLYEANPQQYQSAVKGYDRHPKRPFPWVAVAFLLIFGVGMVALVISLW